MTDWLGVAPGPVAVLDALRLVPDKGEWTRWMKANLSEQYHRQLDQIHESPGRARAGPA